MSNNFIEDDDFDRDLYWQEVPDENSCSRFVAENYYITGYNNSNTYGYYNGGWEYRLMPLNTNLSQKGNDSKFSNVWGLTVNDRIYVGTPVRGRDVDGNAHKGKVINFSFKPDDHNSVKYIWIFDEKSMKQVALVPKTVRVIATNMYMPGGQNKVKNVVSLEDIYKNKGRLNEEAVDIMSMEDDTDYASEYWCINDEHLEELKADDVPYRAAVLKLLKLDEVDPYVTKRASKMDQNLVLKILDDKFYTNLFSNHTIYLRFFKLNDITNLLGLDSDKVNGTTIKKYMQELYDIYIHLLDDGKYNDKPTIKKAEGNQIDISYENYSPYIYSYKCIYLFIKTIMLMFNKYSGCNELHRYNVIDFGNKDFQIWNHNCKNQYYLKVLKYTLIYAIFKGFNDNFNSHIDKISTLTDLGYPYSNLRQRTDYSSKSNKISLINPMNFKNSYYY